MADHKAEKRILGKPGIQLRAYLIQTRLGGKEANQGTGVGNSEGKK